MKRFILALLLLTAASAWGTCTTPCVQAKYGGVGSASTSLAVAFDSNVTAGNTILAAVWCKGNTGQCSNPPTDNNGCAYARGNTSLGADTGNGGLIIAIYRCRNAAGGATTVTETVVGGNAYPRIYLMEVSGLATSKDVHSGDYLNDWTGAASNTLTSHVWAQTGDLIVSFASAGWGTGFTLATPTGYTAIGSVDNSSSPINTTQAMFYKVAGSTAEYTTTQTTSGGSNDFDVLTEVYRASGNADKKGFQQATDTVITYGQTFTSQTLTLDDLVTAGNILTLGCMTDLLGGTTEHPTSVTGGGTWSALIAGTDNAHTTPGIIYQAIATGGATTVTVNWSGSHQRQCVLAEYGSGSFGLAGDYTFVAANPIDVTSTLTTSMIGQVASYWAGAPGSVCGLWFNYGAGFTQKRYSRTTVGNGIVYLLDTATTSAGAYSNEISQAAAVCGSSVNVSYPFTSIIGNSSFPSGVQPNVWISKNLQPLQPKTQLTHIGE